MSINSLFEQHSFHMSDHRTYETSNFFSQLLKNNFNDLTNKMLY